MHAMGAPPTLYETLLSIHNVRLIDPLLLITGAKAVSGLFGPGSGRVYSLSYAGSVGDSFLEENNCDQQGDAGAFCTGVCVCVCVCVCVRYKLISVRSYD